MFQYEDFWIITLKNLYFGEVETPYWSEGKRDFGLTKINLCMFLFTMGRWIKVVEMFWYNIYVVTIKKKQIQKIPANSLLAAMDGFLHIVPSQALSVRFPLRLTADCYTP